MRNCQVAVHINLMILLTWTLHSMHIELHAFNSLNVRFSRVGSTSPKSHKKSNEPTQQIFTFGSRINRNFIDKTFLIVANILLQIISTTSAKKGIYYRDGVIIDLFFFSPIYISFLRESEEVDIERTNLVKETHIWNPLSLQDFWNDLYLRWREYVTTCMRAKKRWEWWVFSLMVNIRYAIRPTYIYICYHYKANVTYEKSHTNNKKM